MRASVARTARPEVIGGIGGFAGLFDASRLATYRHPVLATSTDGVGTKVVIAQPARRLRHGRDRPGGDGRGRPGRLRGRAAVHDRLRGLRGGPAGAGGGHRRPAWPRAAPRPAAPCSAARPPSIPVTSARTTSTWPGAATGVVEADAILGPDRVRPGDAVLALASSGLHSNGYSLVRRDPAGRPAWTWARTCPSWAGRSGEELLEPTRIYAQDCLALAAGCDVHAYAHITGGGLAGQPGPGAARPRRRGTGPGDLDAAGDLRRAGRGAGGSPREEMERVFNMGVGMTAVVAAGCHQTPPWACWPRGACPPGCSAR